VEGSNTVPEMPNEMADRVAGEKREKTDTASDPPTPARSDTVESSLRERESDLRESGRRLREDKERWEEEKRSSSRMLSDRQRERASWLFPYSKVTDGGTPERIYQ
jgi:hypothetical protein